MRFRLLTLCILFTTTTLVGCGGSASIPAPPSDAKDSAPPGTTSEMLPTPKPAKQISKKR